MKNILLLLLLLAITSCSDTGENKSYKLVPTDKKISFALDTKTRSAIWTLLPYTDKDEQEYLTLQGFDSNTIHFYDINTGEHKLKIETALEGPDGVGRFCGYYIHNLDSIYLTPIYGDEVILIDRNAHVKSRISIKKAEDGTPFNICSFTHYSCTQLKGDSLYFIAEANRRIEHAPIAAALNIHTGKINTYQPEYDKFPNQNPQKKFGWEGYINRCFNGTNYVYSFDFIEELLVASPSQDQMTRVPAKSRYIDKVKMLDDFGNLTMQDGVENPNYGTIVYDPYREVYYRIAYPATEIGRKLKDREALELIQFGRKKFAIMVFNKDMELIGETMMPDYTYNSSLLFVRKDGLYISCSHPSNESYTDDEICFQRFELKTI